VTQDLLHLRVLSIIKELLSVGSEKSLY